MKKDSSPLKTSIIETSGTPCAMINLEVVERKIKRTQTLCDTPEDLAALIR